MAEESKATLSKVNLIATTVLAIATGWSGWQLSEADHRLKEVEIRLKEREIQRKDSEEARIDRESREKKQLAVYEATVKSLEQKNPQHQRIAQALVKSMLDEPIRTDLLIVFTESGAPEVKKEAQETLAKESKFNADESVVASSSAPPKSIASGFTYDVFWCEKSGPQAQDLANRLRSALESGGGVRQVRVRLLPDSVNSRRGYRHSGYVLRYNSGEERQAAELKRLGDKVFGSAIFQESRSIQATPAYISAFVCPGAFSSPS